MPEQLRAWTLADRRPCRPRPLPSWPPLARAGLPCGSSGSSGNADLALFKGYDIIYDAGLAWLFRRLEPTPSDDGERR